MTEELDELFAKYDALLAKLKSSNWEVVIPKDLEPLVGYKKELKEIFRVLINACQRLIASIDKYSKTSIEDWCILYSRIPVLVRLVVKQSIPDINKKDSSNFKFYSLINVLFELAMIGKIELVKELLEKIEETTYFNMVRNVVVEEPQSRPTKWLSSPKYVLMLAKQYNEYFSDKNIMLISFAFGAIRAGMLAKLYLEKFGFNINYIPVRFSINKWKDTKFMFLFQEDYDEFIDYLLNKKQVVILDEDVSTGQTFKMARQYVQDLLIENVKEESSAKKLEKVNELMKNVVFTSINQLRGGWAGENPAIVDLSVLYLYPIKGRLNPQKILELEKTYGRKVKNYFKSQESTEGWILSEPLNVLSKSEIKTPLSNKELIFIQSNNDKLFEFLSENGFESDNAGSFVLLIFDLIKKDGKLWNSWKSRIFGEEDIKKVIENFKDTRIKPVQDVLKVIGDVKPNLDVLEKIR
ncbi:Uncharacterised protein [Candidatus Tiddalikarchaeum anstoanum]|nr:Uncharacterised protein [Candidatus Tiddalikarchaeum anstoanum]